MKSIVVCVLMLAVSTFVGQTAIAEGPRIAVIDANKVVKESQAGKKALSALDIVRNKKQEEIKQKEEEIKTLQEKLKSPGLQPVENEKLQTEIKQATIEFKRFVQYAQSDIDRELYSAVAKIEERALPIIQRIADAGNFLVVIERDVLVFVHPENTIDITDVVIREFDAEITRGATDSK